MLLEYSHLENEELESNNNNTLIVFDNDLSSILLDSFCEFIPKSLIEKNQIIWEKTCTTYKYKNLKYGTDSNNNSNSSNSNSNSNISNNNKNNNHSNNVVVDILGVNSFENEITENDQNILNLVTEDSNNNNQYDKDNNDDDDDDNSNNDDDDDDDWLIVDKKVFGFLPLDWECERERIWDVKE